MFLRQEMVNCNKILVKQKTLYKLMKGGISLDRKKGKFVLSLDTELAWGSFYNEKVLNNRLRNFYNTRKAISSLINILEKYEISATWAFVGHLMLQKCNEIDGVKHPEIIRPRYKWFEKDWFYYVPSFEEKNSIWYGSDILKMVLNCAIEQEIASHSFSHIYFGLEGCDEECAESDIKRCIEIAELNNITLYSFIFPRNLEGHINLIKKYGFTIYRGLGDEWYRKINNKIFQRIARILDKILSLSPSTSDVQIDEYGLYRTPGNMQYSSSRGIYKILAKKSSVKKAKKGLDRAIEKGEVFHMWFHPFNLSGDIDASIEDLKEILEYANKKINEGYLENVTMKELVDI